MALLISESVKYDAKSPLKHLVSWPIDFTKGEGNPEREFAQLPDSLSAWITCYLRMVVVGVRSEEVTRKITLHLQRFQAFFAKAYRDERISICLRRDVIA